MHYIGVSNNKNFRNDRPMISVNEKLLMLIGQGDGDALEQLYAAASGAVFAYAFSILRDRYDAEDAVQDTFLKIRAAAHLYQPHGKPMAWILTITRNICLMQLRSRSKVTALHPEDPLPDLDKIHNTEDREILKSAFTTLAEDETRIVLLHAVAGLKHRETAELLQMPLSTVLSKYNRAWKKLRQELKGTER